MGKFTQVIVGALEITAGIVMDVLDPTHISGNWLIAAGIGTVIAGIGTLMTPSRSGLAVASRNPVAPWTIVYGRAKIGGTIVSIQESGDVNKYLDLVMVLADHPCKSVDRLLFDNQLVQINGNGDSFTPVQQTVSLASIGRSNNVVTVTTSAQIPLLTTGDTLIIKNVSSDQSLNGKFSVTVTNQTPGVSTTFTYINGGNTVAPSMTGQAKTTWADYKAKVHMEVLLGDHTATFPGMLNGTPYDGDVNNLVQFPGNPWGAQHKLLGKCAVFLRLHYNDQVFSGGLPQISFLVSGKKDIYDPRTGATGYTENAALCIADYLSNKTFGFKAIYGTEISLCSLSAAANTCDERVPVAPVASPQATEPRYALNGAFQLSTKRGEVLQNLLTACAGRITYAGGKFQIFPGVWNAGAICSYDLNLGAPSLHVWSAHTGSLIGGGNAALNIAYSTDGGVTWSQQYDSNPPLPFNAWTEREDVKNTFTFTDIGLVQVRIDLTHSLYQDPIEDHAYIYDIYIQATLSDGVTLAKFRPSGFGDTLYAGNNSLGYPNGTINNEKSAYDAEVSSPPSTYSEIITRRTAPLAANDNTITYGGFQISPLPGSTTIPSVSPLATAGGPFQWKPKLPIRDLFNGVKGTYISPSNNWQASDIPPYAQDTLHGYASGSPLYPNGDANLAADGGDRRWMEIQLPFTISSSTAQRIAKIFLLRSRYQGAGTFVFNMSAYQFSALDVVQFTLPFLGWTNKLLEVSGHRFSVTKTGDAMALGVELDVQETDSSIYAWSATEELTPQGYQQAGLPSFRNTSGPTSPAAYSGPTASVIGADGVARSAINIYWGAPADGYISNGGLIELAYQKVGDTTWTALPSVDASSTTKASIPNVADGQQYNVEIRSVNPGGAPSDWQVLSPITVSGTPTALPAANIAPGAATPGQVLTFNGTAYAPAAVPAGGITWARNEAPSGALDGVNTAFTLAHLPTASLSPPTGMFLLYLNGIFQVEGVDFTRSGSTITFAVAPHVNPKARDAGYMTAIYTY